MKTTRLRSELLRVRSQKRCTNPHRPLLTACRVATPPFTATRLISFNFTGFADADSGPLSFRWGIGSAPGLVDVLPAMPYNGGRVASCMICWSL